MNWRSAAALGAGALALAAAGCRRRETAVAAGDRSQTLLVGNLAEPNDLDPAYPDTLETSRIVMALMEGLAQYDPRSGLPVPAVAERWDVSPDGLAWTFHLRPGVRWSNGDPVTAGDFVYAYRRMLSPGLAADYAYQFFALKNGEAYYAGRISDFSKVGARAADDRTLVLTLAKPVPYLAKMVCLTVWYPVRRATIEKFGRIDQRGTAWTRPGNYVGDGPFVLAEWKPDAVIRVTRSPTYWNRAKVRLREIDFFPIDDLYAEEAMFRTGVLHVTDSIPSDRIAAYRNDPARRGLLHLSPLLATYFYCFNVRRPPLDDPRVRRALALGIDRREIVERIVRGGERPAGRLTPPGIAGFDPPDLVGFRPDEARRLLAEAGFPGGRGFPRLTLLFNTEATHRLVAEAVQRMWRRELGIDVGLANEEGKAWVASLRAGDYDIGRMTWGADYADPSTFLDIMLGDSGNNYSGWKDPAYDRLVTAADHERDGPGRDALYLRAERILAEQCPIAPVYFYTRANLRLPDVRGWYDNPLDEHPYTGVYLESPGR